MTSSTTEAFRKAYSGLPRYIQKQAKEAYQQFKHNPRHPSLQFKKAHSSRPIYSVRVSLGYRAVGVMKGRDIVWFWIGSHADYDRLLSRR